MPDYPQATQGNAAATAAQAGAIIAAWRAGRVETPELPQWLNTGIRVGMGRAVTLADLAVSTEIGRAIGRPVPTVGVTLPEDSADEVAQGLATVLADPEPDAVAARVDLLARSAPLEAGNRGYQAAMRDQGVEGWVRVPHPDCCELCQALADGTVVPISKKIILHPNDRCTMRPVLTGAAPFQRPDQGTEDPAAFVPVTLRTGQGIGGRQITRVAPGLTIRRSVFIPARARTR